MKNEKEFDEVFRSTYKLYRFAIYFVPYNVRANDKRLLERLKKKNSGADKPFVYLLQTFEHEIEVIKDIIYENPTDNISIVLPHGSSDENYNLLVDKYYEKLSKRLYCSKFYEGLKSINCTIF